MANHLPEGNVNRKRGISYTAEGDNKKITIFKNKRLHILESWNKTRYFRKNPSVYRKNKVNVTSYWPLNTNVWFWLNWKTNCLKWSNSIQSSEGCIVPVWRWDTSTLGFCWNHVKEQKWRVGISVHPTLLHLHPVQGWLEGSMFHPGPTNSIPAWTCSHVEQCLL